MKHSFKKAIAILLVAASLTLIGTVSVFAAAPQPDASVQIAKTWNPKLSRNSESHPNDVVNSGAECELNWYPSLKQMNTECLSASSKTIKIGHASAALATANYGSGEAATISKEAYSSCIVSGCYINSGYTTWEHNLNALGKAICEGLMIYEGGGSDSWVITGTFS